MSDETIPEASNASGPTDTTTSPAAFPEPICDRFGPRGRRATSGSGAGSGRTPEAPAPPRVVRRT